MGLRNGRHRHPPVAALRAGGRTNVALVASLGHSIGEPFAGGLEAHTSYLAAGLRRRGHDVTVFAADPGSRTGVDHDSGAFVPSEIARGDVSMPEEAFMAEHHAYLQLMLELSRSDFDVVQNSSLHYLPVAMSPMLGRPLVTTLHTPPTPWLESALRCAGGEAACVSVSRTNAGRWSGSVEVCEVIPNGIDMDVWPFRPEASDPNLAVWSGRITPEKGPHLAALAAREAGLELRLAGPISDPEYFAGDVLPLLSERVRYVGHLTHARLARLVGSAAVVLCTPRWDEPYGLVVAEALACGTPVAAFDKGAVGEILDGETGRLADSDDASSLAEAAREAIGLSRRACRERAESACSAETMVARYGDLYERLLEPV